MNEPIQQSIGIDISKETFTACACQRDLTGEVKLSQVAEFKNTKTGYNQLLKWSRKLTHPSPRAIFVMEATGVYYENLAYHLSLLKLQVSVLLPNMVTHYTKSLNIKTKTDKVDAKVIAQLGVERKVSLWKPPHPVFKRLKELTRHLSDLKCERTVYKNRLHANKSSHDPLSVIIKSNRAMIRTLDIQIFSFEQQIKDLIDSESWLKSKVKKVITIKGVGLITVATILGETHGFEFVKNIRQLTSYAGYDIITRESGISVRGKTRISKKGNSRIRAALFLPALCSTTYNKDLQAVYQRIVQNKPSGNIGLTALQRKLLILIYTLWRKDEEYIEGYQKLMQRKAGRSIENLPAQDVLELHSFCTP